MVEALKVVFPEKRTVLGFTALRHALAEVNPKVIAPPFVSCNTPP